MDGFLKTIVTPILVSTGIGALMAPLTFFLEYSLQPVIHSIAFLVFDDSFLLATLETTGIQSRMLQTRQWHKLSFLEGMLTRYVVKSISAWCLAWAGVLTIVPLAGNILTAILTGWVVTWDYVYVPLSGMGHVGPWQQFRMVWKHLWAFQWYGFWAVLVEEIPVLGPSCHVYNVYSAAFLLERLFADNDGDGMVATAMMRDSDEL